MGQLLVPYVFSTKYPTAEPAALATREQGGRIA